LKRIRWPASSAAPVDIHESFSTILSRMTAAKLAIMKRNMALLEQRRTEASLEAMSLFGGYLRTTDFPLDSPDFVFIFAFQRGVIRQLSYLSVGLALHFVKLALYLIVVSVCFHDCLLGNEISSRDVRDDRLCGLSTH